MNYDELVEWCERLQLENGLLRKGLIRQLGDKRICPACLHEYHPKDATYKAGCDVFDRLNHTEECKEAP